MQLNAERVEVGDYFAWLDEAYRRNWTDGLPVVPPTPDRVEAMIAASGRDPAEELGELPPKLGVVTIEKLAINSVMAGCRPEYFPVVVAATEAMLEPSFNIGGVQVTTHSNEPLVILSGPIVRELGVNTGHGCFGNGNRANGTIGRAIKLILWNLGGSYPGEPDKSTYAHPGKWSFCIGESLDSPWPPIHAEEAGLPVETSAVTVFGCEAPQSILLHGDAEHVLRGLCDAIAHPGSNNFAYMGQVLLCVNAENARLLAAAGYTKQSIRERIWEQARIPKGLMKRGSWADDYVRLAWPAELAAASDDTLIPPVLTPRDIHVVAAGGEGKFCCQLPGWGVLGGCAITKPIRQGTPG